MRSLATTVVVNRGRVWQAQIGMVERHAFIRLSGCLCFKVDGQVAVYQGWSARDISEIVAGHGVD